MPTRPHLKGSLPRLTRSFGDNTTPRYCAMLLGASSCQASAARGGRMRPGPSRSRMPPLEPVSTGSSSSSLSSSEHSPGFDEELEGGGGGSRCPLAFSALFLLPFAALAGGPGSPTAATASACWGGRTSPSSPLSSFFTPVLLPAGGGGGFLFRVSFSGFTLG